MKQRKVSYYAIENANFRAFLNVHKGDFSLFWKKTSSVCFFGKCKLLFFKYKSVR